MSRTITHTGASAPLNFTVIAPDQYTFVFSPNRLKITLGAGYSATQAVTIAANGITKTRNAIARVVYFDLADIFRSYFDGSDFTLPTTGVLADPFYQTDFNVVVTAATGEAENVPFRLRWGAEQFDRRLITTAFTFPYWAGLPLVLNSAMNHESYSITTDTTPITGTSQHAVWVTNTGDTFTYTVNVGSSDPLFPERVITFEKQCAMSGIYLQWVDSFGAVWYFNFIASKRTEHAETIKTGDKIAYYPLNIDDSTFGREKVVTKQKSRKLQAFASVDEAIYDIVSSVCSSPDVRWWDGSRWIGVNIGDVTLNPSTSWTKDFEFIVELPEDYVQER